MRIPTAIITINNRFPNIFYYLTPAFFQAAFVLMNSFSQMDELTDRVTNGFQTHEDTFDFVIGNKKLFILL